jgi:uncharacterized repeat protein (TIGR01451 family)
LLVRNLTGVLSGAGTVTFTFSSPLSYIQANPAPTSINGNTLTWNMPSLGVFQQRNYNITLQVPPDIGLLGTELASSASVTVANTDVDLTNNTAQDLLTVTGAYDPNDKLATTTAGVPGTYLIGSDDEIAYTIRFQNTGTDTAFFVVITDTLPATLDPATFRAGPASHTHSLTMQGNGVLRWTFPNILLPDSNVNEPRSHGWVRFYIKPHLPVLPGTDIENIANIYFDYNPPVITDPCVLNAATGTALAEQDTSRMQCYPVPAIEHLQVLLPPELAATRLEIRAMDGRLCWTGPTTGPLTTMDIKHLPNGLYAVQAFGPSGAVSAARFIVTR